ncbi:FkbH domain-containing protein [Aeromonas cavernicola]|uniref:FkbH domain-containing protein n=2 Tax=Aeromonas cavernicola TaxID=1006623 RepID=A0A2H9U330_9GAMM|nr:FkbH domain-containing protein [Aeromonas cavernicola]
MPGNVAWRSLSPATEVHVAPHGQWLQTLMSQPADAEPQTHIIIWLWEDLVPTQTLLTWERLAEEGKQQAVTEWLNTLCQPLVQRLQLRPQDTLLVGAYSRSPASVFGTAPSVLARLSNEFDHQLASLHQRYPSLSNLHLPLWLQRHGYSHHFDSRNYYLMSCPFSMTGLVSLAEWIAPLLHRLHHPAHKVLVLDCDNTLWGGVVGEDGIAGISLGQDGIGRVYQAFQQAVCYWHSQGVILALCSKNGADDVWHLFDRHQGMVLTRQQITAAEIGWDTKSAGLRRLAQQLNVGLESMVFWDDSELERSEVRANCPEVTVVTPPSEIWEWPDALMMLTALHRHQHSPDDQLRQRSYRAKAQAQEVQQQLGDERAFLQQLRLAAKWQPLAPSNQLRAEQLTQKTNQFNLSGKRYQAGELALFAKDQGDVWLASLQDKFADHGMTALLMVRPLNTNTALLDTLAISCRVLGRGFEYWLLAQLATALMAKGISQLVISYIATDRNQPARNFLATLPTHPVAADVGYVPQADEILLSLDLPLVSLPYLEFYTHE